MKAETRSFYEAAVQRTVAHIVRGLDEAMDLVALARGAALSPFHFHRVFRGMVGETPLEMHRRLRLERAAWQLTTTDAAVTTIAFDAGYETHEAFTRAFRQAYGASPSAYRQGAATGCRPPQVALTAPSGVHFSAGSPGEPVITFITGVSTMHVTIESLPAQRAAVVHHLGPYAQISGAFARLGAIVGPAGLLQFPEAAMLGIYYDDPETTPPEQLRADAGIVVPQDVALPAGLDEVRLPAGRYARTTHVGPYSQLGDVWARLMGQWLPVSGHRVGEGASFELYRNTPMNAAPHELRTELFLPLA